MIGGIGVRKTYKDLSVTMVNRDAYQPKGLARTASSFSGPSDKDGSTLYKQKDKEGEADKGCQLPSIVEALVDQAYSTK